MCVCELWERGDGHTEKPSCESNFSYCCCSSFALLCFVGGEYYRRVNTSCKLKKKKKKMLTDLKNKIIYQNWKKQMSPSQPRDLFPHLLKRWRCLFSTLSFILTKFDTIFSSSVANFHILHVSDRWSNETEPSKQNRNVNIGHVQCQEL